MSFEAVKWANEQPTTSAAEHLLLLQLANLAGPDGIVRFLDIERLTRVAKQSRATVFRRLREFEAAGVLTRDAFTWREDGAKIAGAKLWLDRTWREPDAMQETHSDEDAAEAESDAETGAPEGGQSQNETACPGGGSLTQNVRQSHSCETASLNVSKIINYNPPSPPSGSERSEEADEGSEPSPESAALDEWLMQFQGVYPFDATMSRAEARRVGAGLSIKDRARALRFAADYAADLKRRGGTRPLDAARWLRERRFEEIERLKVGQAKAIGLEKPLVFVARGTRAWDAWIAHGHKPGLDHSRHGGKSGWWFPSLWPPGVDPPAGEA